ncbi:hypothetical protein DVT68_16210 [Dyella solisilvae]|uniref:Uncharacterized protein n=1 Tax=Dyella solisilvae TaxID=1920168 RepID=A0A370K3V0_9GAMM|nr:hypothetical protein [Dyella solisilvae]RDI97309.1 hypothetical protein DVT68_16210 [Dyella solisilvae]
MNSTSQAVYENRIEHLERSLRRTQWMLFGLLLVVIALGLAWYGIGGITQRRVTANRVVVVDDSGAVRIRLGQDKQDTKRVSRAAGVVLYDKTGHERGGMATMDNGRVALGLDAPNVADGKESDRVGMMVDAKGHVMFAVADNQGIPVVMMKSADAGGTLQVMAATPDQKQVDVRTIGVKGDTQSTMGGG